MLFQINGLHITNLQKAKNDLVTVDIIANHLTEDSEGETTLKEAFSADTVNDFLKYGVIEFWHESRNPLLSKEEKNKNLIGKPTSFRWEGGKPVVTADLTKNHPIVKDMLPHLEAGNPVYAASLGGAKVVLEAQGPDGQIHKVIPRIKWDHLAIAPSNMVVNREGGVNVRMLAKAQDICAEFDTIDAFTHTAAHIFSQETELRKALTAPGSVGDLHSTPGGALTKQDLEKTVSPLTFSEDDAELLLDTIIKINHGSIPLTREGYYNHFNTQKEFADKSYRLFDKFFKKEKR